MRVGDVKEASGFFVWFFQSLGVFGRRENFGAWTGSRGECFEIPPPPKAQQTEIESGISGSQYVGATTEKKKYQIIYKKSKSGKRLNGPRDRFRLYEMTQIGRMYVRLSGFISFSLFLQKYTVIQRNLLCYFRASCPFNRLLSAKTLNSYTDYLSKPLIQWVLI